MKNLKNLLIVQIFIVKRLNLRKITGLFSLMSLIKLPLNLKVMVKCLEGVQRDILPIVEGSIVNTKYGTIETDHILFIASGAFHLSKPSDLIPELQVASQFVWN